MLRQINSVQTRDFINPWFKRDFKNAIESELIKLSRSEFQQSMQRQENENERAIMLDRLWFI